MIRILATLVWVAVASHSAFASPPGRVLMATGAPLDTIRVVAMSDAATALGLSPDFLVLSGGASLAGYLLTQVPDANRRIELMSLPEAAQVFCPDPPKSRSYANQWRDYVESTATQYRKQTSLSVRVPRFFDLPYFSKDSNPIQLLQVWKAALQSSNLGKLGKLGDASFVPPSLVFHGFEWQQLPHEQQELRDLTRIFLRELWMVQPNEYERLKGSESALHRDNLHGALARSVLIESTLPLETMIEIATSTPMHRVPYQFARGASPRGQSGSSYLGGAWNQFPFELATRLGGSVLVADDGKPDASWEDRLSLAWSGISLVNRWEKAKTQPSLKWVDFGHQAEFFSLVWNVPYATQWAKERCVVGASKEEYSRWVLAYYLYAYEQTLKALRL